MMKTHVRTHLLALALLVTAGLGATPALAQGDTAEGLILTVARARDLARTALDDAVLPIGSLLNQIGPSSVFAADDQGFGNWSLSLGAGASKLTMTSPDYTVDDPSGDDAIEGGVGAAYADLSLGLFRGYRLSSGRNTVGSVDLLFRLGYTLGDQENLAEEIDLGSWGPIIGGGLRLGLLKGPGLPSVSLAAGANYFQRRVFAVQIEDEDASVELDFEQTSAFLLLEVGKRLGPLTPYVVGGMTHHRLEAAYRAEVVYGDGAPAMVRDDVDNKQTAALFYGGLELGSTWLRLSLEGGVSDGDPFGRFFFRIAG
jgi:hypothetical protein